MKTISKHHLMLRLTFFLIINFGALALGGLFTSKGVSSDWYAGLNKAPWTPPGWVFGFAWTIIMVCYSFYMAKLTLLSEDIKTLFFLFALQWILNVAWNPSFFYFQQVLGSLFIISLLTALMAYFLFANWKSLGWFSLFIAPYFLWLLVATSLNGYIYLKN